MVVADREVELRLLRNAVRNGERLFLIGPRRYGKTSLLNYMQSQFESDELGDARQRLDDPFLATWLRIARTA